MTMVNRVDINDALRAHVLDEPDAREEMAGVLERIVKLGYQNHGNVGLGHAATAPLATRAREAGAQIWVDRNYIYVTFPNKSRATFSRNDRRVRVQTTRSMMGGKTPPGADFTSTLTNFLEGVTS